MDWNGSDLLLFRYIVKGGFPFPAAGVMSPEVEDLIRPFLVAIGFLSSLELNKSITTIKTNKPTCCKTTSS
jgi:hypothetical protein